MYPALLMLVLVAFASSASAVAATPPSFSDMITTAHSAARNGELDTALAMYADLYHAHIDDAPLSASHAARAASGAASRSGDHFAAAQWLQRAIDAQAMADAASASPSVLLNDAMRLSQLHTRNGASDDAIESMELAVSVVESFPRGSVSPYSAYQAAFQLGSLYAESDNSEGVTRAFEAAERYLRDAPGERGLEHLMLRYRLITQGTHPGPDTPEKFAALVELYEDPVFKDLPDRLTIVGRYAVTVAYFMRDLELAEGLAQDIFEEAARFEALIGPEAAREARVDNAYMQSAGHLAMLYRREGLLMRAAETYEHALTAYPSHAYAADMKTPLLELYDRLGIDPESRRDRWAPPTQGRVQEVPAATAPGSRAPERMGAHIAQQGAAARLDAEADARTAEQNSGTAKAVPAWVIVLGVAIPLLGIGGFILRRR